MAMVCYQENPTLEMRDAYWKASDELEDKLSEYYAASIMFLKVNSPELYEVYINLTKREVMDRMLNRLLKKKGFAISQQFAEKRIDELTEKIKALKKAKKPIPAQMKNQLTELKKQLK